MEPDAHPASAPALSGDWGGVREGGQWGAVRPGLVWPMRVVMAVFRGTQLAAIRQGVVQGPRQLNT